MSLCLRMYMCTYVWVCARACVCTSYFVLWSSATVSFLKSQAVIAILTCCVCTEALTTIVQTKIATMYLSGKQTWLYIQICENVSAGGKLFSLDAHQSYRAAGPEFASAFLASPTGWQRSVETFHYCWRLPGRCEGTCMQRCAGVRISTVVCVKARGGREARRVVCSGMCM